MVFPEPVIVGQSAAIKRILEIIQKVGSVDFNVLITGESGVGKEVVARCLHYYSIRRDQPFVKVNSAALPGELIESELFGYEKGAFTGADKRKTGMFESAGQGSIFLDEIGELPVQLQAKLLMVLQDRYYYRIGGHKEVKLLARVIAATNRNLEAVTEQGHFRSDLFYRLNTVSIRIPPLRERKEDIPLLVEFISQKIRTKNPQLSLRISSKLMDLFMQYHWSGNVRELENCLNRLSVLENYEEVEQELSYHIQKPEDVRPETIVESEGNPSGNPAPQLEPEPDPFPSLKEVRDQAVKEVERKVISEVLQQTNWNRRQTARRLKISYRSLLYKIKELDIRPPYS